MHRVLQLVFLVGAVGNGITAIYAATQGQWPQMAWSAVLAVTFAALLMRMRRAPN